MINMQRSSWPQADPRELGTMPSFAHEMLREIYEQPEALRPNPRPLSGPERPQAGSCQRMLAGWADSGGEVLIAASGSSRHSGLAAEILLEDLCGLAVDVEYASEYSCRGGQQSAVAIPACWCSRSRARPPTRWLPCARRAGAGRRHWPSPTPPTRPWRSEADRLHAAGRGRGEGDSGHQELHLPVGRALPAGAL